MKIAWRPNLQIKLILAFVLVLLIPTAVIGTYTINTSSATLIAAAQATNLQNAQRDTDLIGSFLGRSSVDALTVSQSSVMRDYVNALVANDDVAVQRTLFQLHNLLSTYVQNQPYYDNISVLDLSGQETLRVNRAGGNISFAKPADLQNRADQSYFIDALSLAPGQIAISRLTLGTGSNNAIEKPYKPVLHFSAVVRADNNKLGVVVVIDLLGQSVTSLLIGYTPGEQVYLIDSDGTYLAGPDADRLYGRDLNNNNNFLKDSPHDASYILAQDSGTTFGSTDHPDLMQSFARLYPIAGGTANTRMSAINAPQQYIHWTVYRVRPIAAVLTSVDSARTVVLILSILAFLLAILLASLITFQIVRPVRQLAKAAVQIGAGQWNVPLPKIQSRDEIGDLTGSFNEMTGALRVAYNDLKQRTEDLERANVLAQESSRLKSEFMATMSHELRTPLNAMLGFSGLMLEGMGGELDEEALHMVERIDANSRRLLGLINDILDIARIEAGRLEIVSEPIDLPELISAWQSQMSVLAERKGLTFNVALDPGIPPQIYGDREHLTQIVVNLLSNAFKFTQAGSVTLGLKRDLSHLIIEVRDTGIGIPPHAITYIFDEFRQVDGTTQRAFGGTGLGLAIVRNLSQMMAGRVQVSSTPGEGSIFTVTLPLKPVEQPVTA